MKQAIIGALAVSLSLGLAACSEQAAPDAAENQAVVLKFYDLMDAGELDRLDEVLAPDFTYDAGGSKVNREEVVALIRVFYTAFPDLDHEVVEIFAAGNRVVARAIDRGTHLGEFEGIAPTGVRFEISQIAILEMRDGKIAEIREVFDLYGLIQQINGAAPAETAD